MAYSILLSKKGSVDWEKFNENFLSISNSYLEVFPISKEKDDNTLIGLSIPYKNVDNKGEYLWANLSQFIEICISNYSLELYDLYNGEYISLNNLDKLKSSIFE